MVHKTRRRSSALLAVVTLTHLSAAAAAACANPLCESVITSNTCSALSALSGFDCSDCCHDTLPPSAPPSSPSPPDINLSHATLYRGLHTTVAVTGAALSDGDKWALVPCEKTYPCKTDPPATPCQLASTYYNAILGGVVIGGALYQCFFGS